VRRVLASWWVLALAAALTLAVFHRLALSDLILGRGDTFSYFYPYWGARDLALRAGMLPLWSPDLFMGVPLLANSQLGTFYLPNWLTVGLPPPDAVRISILIHVVWAFLGTYVLARRALNLDLWGALAAAALFAFGGYMGGRVEQINQLQGLAWMPWLFALLHEALERRWQFALLLSAGLALQFLTGHTQTVFITAAGLALYALMRRPLRGLLIVGAAGGLAVILSLPQLLPTLDLTAVSNRSGGLNPNQVTAFSFSPFVMGRGLLPNYDMPIFGEYIAYLGVIGIGLALIGGAARAYRPWLILAVVGLVLAFGLYNPVYWGLASLPGFNLFRVPARWLALFALAAALLAGAGITAWRARRVRLSALLLIAVVGGLALSALLLTARNPDSTPVTPPEPITLAGWIISLGIALGALFIIRDRRIVAALLLVEIGLASSGQAFNLLVLRETYTAPRFTAAQIGTLIEDQLPPGRMLSISHAVFDPGDLDTLMRRYTQSGMSSAAIQFALTDIKLQEVLAPNLPLVWGIPTIDGFDGGVLPTRYYTAFTSLLLPDGALRTVDGRLREALADAACGGACIPDQRWLNLSGTRYLVIDKVFDLWREGVAYDTALEVVPRPDQPASYDNLQRFEATAVDVLFACLVPDCDPPRPDLAGEWAGAAESLDRYLWLRFALDQPDDPAQIALLGDGGAALRAVTLIDTRTGDFQQLAPRPWTRILSSDIKLYENAAVFPRAFIVYDAVMLPDSDFGTEAALEVMRAPDFDPQRTVIVHGQPGLVSHARVGGAGEARITRYTSTGITIEVESDRRGWLVLTEAYYPGWRAASQGESRPLARANVMFRAVPVEAGASTLEVVFEERRDGVAAGLIAWIALGGVFLASVRSAGHRSRAD
jgi:hypothetical protein